MDLYKCLGCAGKFPALPQSICARACRANRVQEASVGDALRCSSRSPASIRSRTVTHFIFLQDGCRFLAGGLLFVSCLLTALVS